MIVIVAVIAVASVAVVFSMGDHTSYKNVTIDGVVCEVPDENVTVKEVSPNYHIYDDSKNNLTIMVYNQVSSDENTTDNTTASDYDTFIQQKNSIQTGSMKSKDGFSYNCSNSEVYSFYGNYSGKNVLIKTANENVIGHILKSLNVTPLKQQLVVDDSNNTTADNETTTQVNTVTKTKVVTKQVSTSNSEDNNKQSTSSSKKSSSSSSGKSSGRSSSGGNSSGGGNSSN